MKVEPSAPLFIRTSVKLSRIAADLDRAKVARSDMEGVASHLRREELERVRDALNDRIGRVLHNIYCGVESTRENIAETVDGEKPSGNRWNSGLLDQMSVPTSRRPAVMDDHAELRDLMRFRHVFRSVYGEPLRHEEVLGHLEVVDELVLPKFLSGLDRLERYLRVDVGGPLKEPSGSGDDDGLKP